MLNIILHQNGHSTAEQAKLIGPLLARSHLFSPESALATPPVVQSIQEKYKALRGPNGREQLELIKKEFQRVGDRAGPNVYPSYALELLDQYLSSPKKPRLVIAEECSQEEANSIWALNDQENHLQNGAMEDWALGNYESAQKKLCASFQRANQFDTQREKMIVKRAQNLALSRQKSSEASNWLLCLGSGHYRMADRLKTELSPELAQVEHDLVLPHEVLVHEVARRRHYNGQLSKKINPDFIDQVMVEGIAQQFLPNEVKSEGAYATALSLASLTPQQRSRIVAELRPNLSNREQSKSCLTQHGLIIAAEEAKAIFNQSYGRRLLDIAPDGQPYIQQRSEHASIQGLMRTTKVA